MISLVKVLKYLKGNLQLEPRLIEEMNSSSGESA